jgi:hypothetical protein
MKVLDTLEKIAPGHIYGFSREGHIFVDGNKTEVTLIEVEDNAPREAVEAAAEAIKSELIHGSHIEP